MIAVLGGLFLCYDCNEKNNSNSNKTKYNTRALKNQNKNSTANDSQALNEEKKYYKKIARYQSDQRKP